MMQLLDNSLYGFVFFADEPSGNLDSESAENLLNLFFKLRNEFE
jgi:lipoprotein-releasing system ATP-binding protein